MIANRLISEKSPYLMQHAYNPVDWYPWGQEAFDKAARENKPIFLSIGYSTCHWCHVMEKESFEDEQVAGLMNDAFVSIKVDREERPDIDHVYMTVCQLMAGNGGWPLTIIMAPDKQPFFAGTYFPKKAAFGRIGMADLIPRLKQMWETDRQKLIQLSEEITARLLRENTAPAPAEPEEAVFHEAFEQLINQFDHDNGGFSQAPKFPAPHILLFLLRYGKRTGNQEALHMATKTLNAMRDGGIYDHIGFGFHRYSTDARWLVPHFEKMLYDQAMLCIAYTEAFQATGNEDFRNTAEDVLSYISRDMTSPEGGFYSAEDADSEGEEGRFYVWTHSEITGALEPGDAELICSSFNIQREGNFFDQATNDRTGSNILHRGQQPDATAQKKELTAAELPDRIKKALARLFAVREQRIHPDKDDKILTDWNGLMITAFAKAAKAFQRPDYAAAAAKAADFILSRLRTPDGRLIHRYRDGDASLPAHTDDYAFFISGLIELYLAGCEPRYLEEALRLNSIFIRHFWDNVQGGFFFTADDGEKLLVRRKEIYDGAVPSGNSMALFNLLRLAGITGDVSLAEMASKAARTFFTMVRQAPTAYTYFLMALDSRFDGTLKNQ
ncbi:MAG: thioredoxin domain-containing protein [Nitrospirae bacterium]|nr:thioredoxin domain-containing protein [Nitrospirota bacterium]